MNGNIDYGAGTDLINQVKECRLLWSSSPMYRYEDQTRIQVGHELELAGSLGTAPAFQCLDGDCAQRVQRILRRVVHYLLRCQPDLDMEVLSNENKTYFSPHHQFRPDIIVTMLLRCPNEAKVNLALTEIAHKLKQLGVGEG